MVFLGGPRQVGKTTLALSLLAGGNETHRAYEIAEYKARILPFTVMAGIMAV